MSVARRVHRAALTLPEVVQVMAVVADDDLKSSVRIPVDDAGDGSVVVIDNGKGVCLPELLRKREAGALLEVADCAPFGFAAGLNVRSWSIDAEGKSPRVARILAKLVRTLMENSCDWSFCPS